MTQSQFAKSVYKLKKNTYIRSSEGTAIDDEISYRLPRELKKSTPKTMSKSHIFSLRASKRPLVEDYLKLHKTSQKDLHYGYVNNYGNRHLALVLFYPEELHIFAVKNKDFKPNTTEKKFAENSYRELIS
jgi:hypothetical protein